MKREEIESTLQLDAYVPYLVNRAATAMLNYSADEFQQLGLSVPQWRILLTLSQHRECRFGELAELTSIEPPTLSRLLKGMSEERLVSRKRDAADERGVVIRLAPAGRALYNRCVPFALRCEDVYFEGLDPAELAALRSALGKVYANVQRASAEREPQERRRESR